MSNTEKKVTLDCFDLRQAGLVLRAVNHPLRQKMMNLLQDKNPMSVTDIYTKLRIEQSVASQHLAILRRAGFVSTDRHGKFIYYELNHDRISQVSKLVQDLIG